MRRRSLLLIASILLLSALVWLMIGCSDSNDTETPGDGTMRVFLIDEPGDYDEVNVEVVGVEVHRSGDEDNAGWRTIDVDTTYVDLLSLTNGNSVVLADSTLPAGQYTQVRLILGEGNTVVVDGETHPLVVPSGGETGLKLNHPFTIEPETLYEITLDFNADRSIHLTGNGVYMLRPVIRVIVNASSGTVIGDVEPVAARARIWTVAGEDTVSTYADTLSGEFRFAMLATGAYDLHFEATAGAYRDTLLEGVAVNASETTDVGTVAMEEE